MLVLLLIESTDKGREMQQGDKLCLHHNNNNRGDNLDKNCFLTIIMQTGGEFIVIENKTKKKKHE